MDVEAKITELRQLPVEDRRRVLRELWETLPTDYPSSLFTEDELAELRRRLAEFRANPRNGATLDEMERAVEERRRLCPAT